MNALPTSRFMLSLEVLVKIYDPDYRMLDRLIESMWDKPARSQLLMFIKRGALDAYQLKGGLVLLETSDWLSCRELTIYGMVGRGILKQADAIIRDLRRIAVYKGCSRIGGVGVPKGWARAAPKLGFAPVSTHYVMEL